MTAELITSFIARLRANVEYAKNMKYSVTQLATLQNYEAKAMADWMQEQLERGVQKYMIRVPTFRVRDLVWVKSDTPGMWSARAGGVSYEVATDWNTGVWVWSWSLNGDVRCYDVASEEAAKAAAYKHFSDWCTATYLDVGLSESIDAEDLRTAILGICDDTIHVAAHSPFWSEYQCTYLADMREKIATVSVAEAGEQEENGDE